MRGRRGWGWCWTAEGELQQVKVEEVGGRSRRGWLELQQVMEEKLGGHSVKGNRQG